MACIALLMFVCGHCAMEFSFALSFVMQFQGKKFNYWFSFRFPAVQESRS